MTSFPRKKASPVRSLSKEDWIAAATELLIGKSADEIRVESLAKQLRITTGSFYYHFKDRGDLLAQVLESWRESATAQIIRQLELAHAAPRQIVEDMLALPFHGHAARRASMIELSVRVWGRQDEAAQRVISDVDAQRLAYAEQCFRALGCSSAESKGRAFSLYGYLISQSMLWHIGDTKQKKDLLAHTRKLLLDDLPAIEQINRNAR
ncbi:TetR/AcrR family transcriptional regulator [Burkholderia alba]|uniref:TetR/AcrR family transcriptional regulator n=1 Tax=Burkholderia alba TaxID=2683677 RepID=UPI002B053EEA|nr:TetR/AcrR family transcriptional regulator [Burkholderia alba]